MENLNIINRRYIIILITAFVFLAMFSPIATAGSEKEVGYTLGALPPSNDFTDFRDCDINISFTLGTSFTDVNYLKLFETVENAKEDSQDAVEALIAVLLEDSNYEVRTTAFQALYEMAPLGATEQLVQALPSGNGSIRRNAAYYLSWMADYSRHYGNEEVLAALEQQAVEPLIEIFLGDESLENREIAAYTLVIIGDREGVDEGILDSVMQVAAHHPNKECRKIAFLALSEGSRRRSSVKEWVEQQREYLKDSIRDEFGVRIEEKFGVFSIDQLLDIHHVLYTLSQIPRFQEHFNQVIRIISAQSPEDFNSGTAIPGYGKINLNLGLLGIPLIVHEIGHLVHGPGLSRVLEWLTRVKEYPGIDTRKFMELHNRSSSEDIPSDHGKENWMEDFAMLFGSYMTDCRGICDYARIRAEDDENNVLLEKLKIVIEPFISEDGDEIYIFHYDRLDPRSFSATFKIEVVPIADDGLPQF